MEIVIPDEGCIDVLKLYVGQARPDELVLRLFANDIHPGRDDSAARYVEPAGHGYAAVRLKADEWRIVQAPAPANGAAALRPPPLARAREVSFVFTGAAGDVFGYFLTRAGSGRIAHAQRFDQPIRVVNNGDRIRVVAQISQRSRG